MTNIATSSFTRIIFNLFQFQIQANAGSKKRTQLQFYIIIDLMDQSSFKILVTTNIHLGYLENNHIQKNDSFQIFQEILNIAKEQQPDLLIVGGNLFHNPTPSTRTVYKSLTLLENNIFGSKDIQFMTNGGSLNFLNPNLNICLPIVLMHGSHDYPQADGLSICNNLQAINYVNYFGKYSGCDQIVIKPLIVQKKQTIVAFYFVGYIHPLRLSKYGEKGIKFEESPENAFKVAVIHQPTNHKKDVALNPQQNSYGYELKIPEWMDMVINTFQNISFPQLIKVGNQLYYCPGSAIPISLKQEETINKHVGLLSFHQKQVDFKPLFLKKLRRYIYITINFQELQRDQSQQIVKNTIMQKLQIQNFQNSDMLDFVKVKLLYDSLNKPRFLELQRFFFGKVANPGEVFNGRKIRKKNLLNQMQKQDSGLDQTDAIVIQNLRIQQNPNQFQIKFLENLKKSYLLLIQPQNMVQIVQSQFKSSKQKFNIIKAFEAEFQKNQSQCFKSTIHQIRQLQKQKQNLYKSSCADYKKRIQKNISQSLYQNTGQIRKSQDYKERIQFQTLCGVQQEKLKENYIFSQILKFAQTKKLRPLQMKKRHTTTNSLNLQEIQDQETINASICFLKNEHKSEFEEISQIVRIQSCTKKNKKKSKAQKTNISSVTHQSIDYKNRSK